MGSHALVIYCGWREYFCRKFTVLSHFKKKKTSETQSSSVFGLCASVSPSPSNTRPLGPAGCPDITMVTLAAFPSFPFLAAEAARGPRWEPGVPRVRTFIHKNMRAARCRDKLLPEWKCASWEQRTSLGEQTI